jgi:hypothetical protein
MSQVRQTFPEPVAPDYRVPRKEMLKIANSYYEAIVRDNGKLAPYADECQRRENGGITEKAGNYGHFDLPAAHVFKIHNGKIYEIEAIGYVPQHVVKIGWE